MQCGGVAEGVFLRLAEAVGPAAGEVGFVRHVEDGDFRGEGGLRGEVEGVCDCVAGDDTEGGEAVVW